MIVVVNCSFFCFCWFFGFVSWCSWFVILRHLIFLLCVGVGCVLFVVCWLLVVGSL